MKLLFALGRLSAHFRVNGRAARLYLRLPVTILVPLRAMSQ